MRAGWDRERDRTHQRSDSPEISGEYFRHRTAGSGDLAINVGDGGTLGNRGGTLQQQHIDAALKALQRRRSGLVQRYHWREQLS